MHSTTPPEPSSGNKPIKVPTGRIKAPKGFDFRIFRQPRPRMPALKFPLPAALQPLTKQKRFVLWRWEFIDGRWTKPPYQARNLEKHASVDKPQTWSTFAEACKAVQANPGYGIGFCLLGSGIAAFDIDNSRKANGDSINSITQQIESDFINDADSYVEVTPSGKGLRIIGTGKGKSVQIKENNLGKMDVSVEVYRDCGRYITITGNEEEPHHKKLKNIDRLIDDTVKAWSTPQEDAPQGEQIQATTTEKEGVPNSDKINRALNLVMGALPDELQTLIREGVPEPDRSDQFHHAVKWLKDLHTKPDVIIRLFKKFQDGIAEKYNGRIVKETLRAYGKPDNTKSKDKSDDANTKDAKSKAKLIQSSEEFTRGFVAPDYLWDGILLKGFCYCITAITGHGKTAIMLALVTAIALGRQFAGRDVEKCRVLYFAGENPDDVRMRWIAMAEHKNFDADFIDVHFVSGTFDILKLEKKINDEVKVIGGVSLVVIDTGPAYFMGDNENDTVQMIAHARMLRRLKDLPGKPTVLAATHPTKSATKENLVPRGGGAFLNELDGNLTAWKEDLLVEVHHQGKFRGVDFEPMAFELEGVIARKLVDSKGRHIPTVIANDLSKEEQSKATSAHRNEEDEILVLLKGRKSPMSLYDIAEQLCWSTKHHKPNKVKAQRMIEPLKKDKLVEVGRDGVMLTKKGEAAAERAEDRNPHLKKDT